MTPTQQTQALFEEHGRFVFRVVRRLGAPTKDVEDLVQEVFLVVYRQIESFDGRSPKGWLFHIASRVTSDYRRRASTQRERLDAASPDQRCPSSDGQEARIWGGQLREALDLALDTLSEAERTIFLLYELENLSMRECAAIAECPEQTGYSRLRAARQKMKRHLCAQADLMRSLSLQEVG